MPGDPLQRRVLTFIRDHALLYGRPATPGDLTDSLGDTVSGEAAVQAMRTLQRLERIVVERRADGAWQFRAAESNPDGTAAMCRHCEQPRENRAAWSVAERCSARTQDRPCEPRWIDYRGRNKVIDFGDLEVTHRLRTIEQARPLVSGRSVWAPLAVDPEWSVPISQGALIALIRAYRNDHRCIGVHVSDERLVFEGGRRGFVVVVDLT